MGRAAHACCAALARAQMAIARSAESLSRAATTAPSMGEVQVKRLMSASLKAAGDFPVGDNRVELFLFDFGSADVVIDYVITQGRAQHH